jgi:pilus assembly protein Flp/PilA
MSKLSHFALDFLRQEDGPTAVEYAVMLAFVIVVCVSSAAVIGSNTSGNFTKPRAAFNSGS